MKRITKEMISANADADSDMNEKTRDFERLKTSWLIHAGLRSPSPKLYELGHTFKDALKKEILSESTTRVEKILAFFDADFTIDQITNVMGVTSVYVRRVLIDNRRIVSRKRGEKVTVYLFNSKRELIGEYDSINKLSKEISITVYKILNAIDRPNCFLVNGLFVRTNKE